jgi:hypothetical protein
MFVLTNSQPEVLEKLMGSLKLTKRDLINMMTLVLKENIRLYNESLRGYYSKAAHSKYGLNERFLRPPSYHHQ